MKTDRPSVLLVDDVATFRETIRLELEDRGYEIQEAGDAREAVARGVAEPVKLERLELVAHLVAHRVLG